MKKLMLVLVLLLGVSTAAVAQDVSNVDIFAGYSFIHCGKNGDLKCNLHGWTATFDFNLNNNWAVTADLGGHYDFADNYDEGETRLKYYNYLVGPKYTIGDSETVRPYIHALYGFNHFMPFMPDYAKKVNFVQAYGGGVDVKVNDKIWVRPVQLEWFGIRNLDKVAGANVRFSAGVVLRIGQK